MKTSVKVAETPAEVLRCRYLIGQVYNREYEVVFSTDRYDLEAKIEPWPHRYLMLLDGDQLAGTIGLYMRDTYVERFGGVEPEDLLRLLEPALAGRYDPSHLREVTKLVVAPSYRGRGLSRYLLGCAHSRAFIQLPGERPPLMVFCAKRSITRRVYGGAGLKTRLVKPFPFYRVHELYRSPTDPMESRLIVPEVDVPPLWHDLALPAEHDPSEMLKELP